ncbi:MAG TPA: NapC/NirT family cytochrome c [Verrucomicrobiae bacterium]
MPEHDKPKTAPGPFRNWLTLAGTIIAAGGLLAFLLLFAIDITAHGGNPYMGLLAYVVAPGFMLLGIAIAFLGVWLHRRQLRKAGESKASRITIDLTRSRDRKILAGAAFGAAMFAMMTAVGSYETYRYTESNQFCGQACHTPMKPEYTAYQKSPHARVDCVECHVGHGAGAYVKAKLNGVHQLVGVITGDYHRPIKTPIPNMRLAQETCEQCHWPNKNSGQLDKTYHHFLADETNTAFAVRLSLNVGGGSPNPGGIHWHMNQANKVEYIAADEQRQTIPWVRVTDASGRKTEYRVPDFTDAPEKHEVRTMDCMDCHNRPAHQFSAPNDSVDNAILAGQIDRTVPWIKSNVVAVLTAEYKTENEGLQGIASRLKELYPGEARVEPAIATAQAIFKQNFFPEMKADWRAYPDNIGHKEWPGCFRCHDGQHKSTDGRMIAASNCNSCHTILAQGSTEADMQKLEAKGHAFFHIDAVNEDFSCNNCHTGGFPRE